MSLVKEFKCYERSKFLMLSGAAILFFLLKEKVTVASFLENG